MSALDECLQTKIGTDPYMYRVDPWMYIYVEVVTSDRRKAHARLAYTHTSNNQWKPAV